MLFVGQVVRHKRVEVAHRGRPAGREADQGRRRRARPARLREAHRDGAVEFLGSVSDDRLADLYARAVALIVPNVEEFGIAAVEAQAAGRPVVAVGRGGRP